MSDSIEPLILDLLEWVGPRGRDYREVIDVWRTSCPRLPVWEEATRRGLLRRARRRGVAVVSVTDLGAELLAERDRRV